MFPMAGREVGSVSLQCGRGEEAHSLPGVAQPGRRASPLSRVLKCQKWSPKLPYKRLEEGTNRCSVRLLPLQSPNGFPCFSDIHH